MKGNSTPSYVLTLRSLPDHNGVPVIIRLRRVLKYALRVCGLKCVAIVPAVGVDQGSDTESGAPGRVARGVTDVSR